MYALYLQDKERNIIFENEIIKEKNITDYITDKKIYFGENFDMNIDFLPNNVEWIIFADECKFTSSLGMLTNNVKGIVFIEKSKCLTIMDDLPSSLIYLIFHETCYFNNHVDSLPQNLQYLELKSKQFNHPVNNLPNNLISLVLGAKFSHPVDKLPQNLIYLEININHINLNNIPPNINFLNIVYNDYNKIKSLQYPVKLKKLTLTNITRLNTKKKMIQIDDKCKNTNNNVCIDFLPDSLKYLEINSKHTKYSISPIPKLMRQIKFIGIDSFDYYSCDFSGRKHILTPIQKNLDEDGIDDFDYVVDFYQ